MATSPNRNQLPPDRRVDDDEDGYLRAATPLTDPDNGEFVDVEPDSDEITLEDTPDGGLLAPPLDGAAVKVDITIENGFYANLAEHIPETIQSAIVNDLIQKIENDKEARKKRDEQYAEGIRRTGLGNDAPGGAEFEGASRVVHPMLTEACIDYESRVIKELWPPSGPVKPKIIGAVTTQKMEQANRIAEHMNFQLTTLMKEARSVMEVTLMQVPLGGSQFIRLWYDEQLKRPRCEFRSIDKMYIPYGAADFYSAERKTFADTISGMEFKKRVAEGMYRDAGIEGSSEMPDESKSQQASNKVEGVDDSGENLDDTRLIYETCTYLQMTPEIRASISDCECEESEDGFYPYIISIDVSTRTMLSMYRNWEQNDDTFEPINHDFEFPFIPWDGAFPIGFPQLIGGLSAAATGALRALMDSAHAQNAYGGLIMKGAGVSGQTVRPQIGEFAEIEVGLETKSIKDVILPFSPTQPSGTLFQLLQFLVESARGVVRSSMDDLQNVNTPVPVGTQMARMEEGLVVFSAIHGRAHAAFNRFLSGLHRLNRLHLPQVVKIDAEGKELIVRRKDYDGPCAVQGVSDPTIYSDQQRFAQLNYIQQRVQMDMSLGINIWKIREVELAGLRLMKWPNPEALLVDQPEPQELNPVNENLSMSLGQPVMVFPDQDHMAHLQVHLDYMKSPMFGMNPIIAPKFLPQAIQHAAEHISYMYVAQTVDTIKAAADGMEPSELMGKSLEIKRKFDGLLAQSSSLVVPEMEQQLQGVMPILQQAQQMLQQLMPKPPMDPAQAAVQAATMETQRKAAADQQAAQHNQQKLQIDAATDAQKNQIAAQQLQITREGNFLQAQADAATQQQANALERERMDVEQQSYAADLGVRLNIANLDSDTRLDIADQNNEARSEAARIAAKAAAARASSTNKTGD